MKVTITSKFPLRGKMIESSVVFPVFSPKIEETMSSRLDFLKQYSDFSLVMKVEKSS